MDLAKTMPRRAVLRGLGASLTLPFLDGLRAGPASPVVVWLGQPLATYITNRNSAYKAGYSFVSLSVFGPTVAPLYNMVMVKQTAPVVQHDYPTVTAADFGSIVAAELSLGFGPSIVAASGPGASPLFSLVFEAQSLGNFVQFGFDPTAFQGVVQNQMVAARILKCAASYGDSTAPQFAAVFTPNPGNTLWNTDGLTDAASDFQARYQAEVSGWCRPSFLTLNESFQYFSCFVDSEVAGSWYIETGLSLSAMTTAVATGLSKGYFPICLQAAGVSPANSLFAAIFVTSQDTKAKKFFILPSGSLSSSGMDVPDIDNQIMQSMQASPVRHASLAIVQGTKLVYARGYTLAEPDWPRVTPKTHFRIASVSKTVTALAIYQLIEKGMLNLTDTVQSHLNLTTPTGGTPFDPNFSAITVQNLLEHTSGLMPHADTDGVAVRDAFLAAGLSANLPVSAPMTDQYIASLSLCVPPAPLSGSVQYYNNCGYYLLGRLVAKLWGKSRPIDAYREHLLAPLSITRIRRARSLIVDQPPDEARYRNPTLAIYPSQMSDAQPLAPDVYGDEQLEILEGQGGLSAAAADLARLIAILIGQMDTPALLGSTITQMLNDGLASYAAQSAMPSTTLPACSDDTPGDVRAGHGFDVVLPYSGPPAQNPFYAQKGGELGSSGNVLQINGNWGFCMQWGGINTVPADWYPDFPEIMSIAMSELDGAPDLFPDYGMPSF